MVQPSSSGTPWTYPDGEEISLVVSRIAYAVITIVFVLIALPALKLLLDVRPSLDQPYIHLFLILLVGSLAAIARLILMRVELDELPEHWPLFFLYLLVVLLIHQPVLCLAVALFFAWYSAQADIDNDFGCGAIPEIGGVLLMLWGSGLVRFEIALAAFLIVAVLMSVLRLAWHREVDSRNLRNRPFEEAAQNAFAAKQAARQQMVDATLRGDPGTPPFVMLPMFETDPATGQTVRKLRPIPSGYNNREKYPYGFQWDHHRQEFVAVQQSPMQSPVPVPIKEPENNNVYGDTQPLSVDEIIRMGIGKRI